MKRFDVCIVGGGLAGSLMAWRLAVRGQRVCLIDDGSATAGSRVAAGLINPVSGKRLALPPLLAEWLPETLRLYRELEEATLRTLVRRLPGFRIFRDEAMRAAWEKRRTQEAFAPWMGAVHVDCPLSGLVAAPWGCGEVMGVRVVDTPTVLEAAITAAGDRVVVMRERVSWSEVERTSTGWQVGEVAASRLVCCEGRGVTANPWFGGLPWESTVGELLKVKVPGLPDTHALLGANYLAPVGPGEFLWGATYDRERSEAAPTATGQAELITLLQGLIHADVEVTGHAAGTRMNTRRRMPVVGPHPEEATCLIFNSLGSRGALYAPVLADRLAAFMVEGESLPESMTVERQGMD